MTFWLILLFTFFFVRYLLPVVLRAVLGGFVRKTMRNGGFGPQAGPGFGTGTHGQHNHQNASQPASPKPGEVRVDYVPPTASQPDGRPASGFKGGEYVEYEEV